jgi:hypothetical protein
MIYTDKDVVSAVVNASDTELKPLFGRNVYTDETNSVLEIRLAIYCPIFEEMMSPFFDCC